MNSWAKLGVDLHLHVEPAGRTGLRAGLEHALRAAVRGGRLEAGTRLPSSRQLAAELGVAPSWRRKISPTATSRYTTAPNPAALVIGYATPPGHAWPAALTAFTTALA